MGWGQRVQTIHRRYLYLDNFGTYNIPVPATRISMVDKIPYHKVYVGTTTSELASIGLPKEVTVSLAGGGKAAVPVREWTVVGEQWNPEKPGVYTFKGTLADKEGIDNSFSRFATCYVNNRLAPTAREHQTEWLDRGVIALKSGNGMFISWRLTADEYNKNIKFNIYRNDNKLNGSPLTVTNFVDPQGTARDMYKIETLLDGITIGIDQAITSDKNYLSIPMQKPGDGTNALGETYTYRVNDGSTGDLDGDGEYEVIVTWYPSNAIDSSQFALTGPTMFDAYKLDGTLLWRMNMGLNLTSGAHYNQFLVYDFNGDGRSEMLIKTADGTTVYGATNGVLDITKVVSQIGKPEDNGVYVSTQGSITGHIIGGPEYISVFKGETGEVIDTIGYEFPVNGNPGAWGDTWYNRSDRFLAAVANLDGVLPSAVYGRGYYERTTFVAYNLVDGKLRKQWVFDTNVAGNQYRGLGNHNISVADVDNDGFDEIIAGSLTLDHDGKVLYAMDGVMGRERGSHGDALHVGVFEPVREGINVYGVHEVNDVASMEYHDGATGETITSLYASRDTGRGVAANITASPGYEFWGWGDEQNVEKGSGIYSIADGSVINNNWRTAGLSANFALYWDGDMLQELLDDIGITKYNENTGVVDPVITFEGCESNNGTKANATLQADILGDWREEVLMRSKDSSELRIYSTTIPTDYRIYSLMHDPLYRLGIAWQNVAYNQPPHVGFYLGEDVKKVVLSEGLKAPRVAYTNKPESVPPSAPNNLLTTHSSQTMVSLKWGASTDNVGVTGYEVSIDGNLAGRTQMLEYTFTGLTPDTYYTFTVKAYDANWNRSSSSNSWRFKTDREQTDITVPVPIPTSTVVPSKPELNSKTGEARVTVGSKEIADAFKNAEIGKDGNKTIRIDVTKVTGATSYTPVVATAVLTAGSSKERIEIKTELGTMIVSGNMLSNAGLSAAKEIGINLGSADKATLSEAVRKNVGDRPVIMLSVIADGKRVEYNNPDSPVVVSIPYKPTAEELKNPENIVVWYIDGAGNAVPIPSGKYNTATGIVSFTTTHFSKYAVAYVFKAFSDLAGYDWARHQIEVLAAKGIIKGTSDTTFSPGANITREDFIVLLVRALGLNAKYSTNFSDVSKDNYSYDALGIAKALGIANGSGRNMFRPRDNISRQDMMVLTARAMKASSKLVTSGTASDLARFTDRKDIAPYAISDLAILAQEGIILEINGRIYPGVKASRADAAALLYKAYNK